MKKIFLSCLFLILLSNLFGQEKEKIVVLDFKTIKIETEIGKAITETFMTTISKSKKYQLIERSQLDQILTELRLTSTDEFNDKELLEVGKLAKSKLVIIGSISKIGYKFIFNARAIDVETGNVKYGESIDVDSENELYNGAKEIAELFGEIKQKFKLNEKNIGGIVMLSTGTALIITGAAMIAYDFNTIEPEVLKMRSDLNYKQTDYENKYYQMIGLFAGGVSALTIGGIVAICGIPMVVYKDKKKILSFHIESKGDLALAVSYKF